MILHYSQNWMMDGLATLRFDTLPEAKKYVREFKSKSKIHGGDSIQIVEVLEEYKAGEIDHGLYGFPPSKN